MISFVDGYFGWLGNQMFQYAATRALALRRGVDAIFPRNDPDLFSCFPRLEAKPKHESGYEPPSRIYRERQFHFDPAVMDLPDGTALWGYFQSERYFSDYARTIRDEFTTPEFEKPVLPGLVSVHVRRGDYLRIQEHHPLLGMDYYNAAMRLFPGYEFLVFSDDHEWARQHFEGPGVKFSLGLTPLQDMALMSRCAHHIIANSSFSWWGAWMNLMPDKRVVTPARWFGPAKAGWDTRDLLPSAWERI